MLSTSGISVTASPRNSETTMRTSGTNSGRKSTREHNNGQMSLTLVDWTASTIVRISTPRRREGVEYALSPLRPNNRI